MKEADPDAMNTDKNISGVPNIPGTMYHPIQPRIKTQLEEGVNQIISRRNFRFRGDGSMEQTTVPKTYHDDQGQFSSASRSTDPSLTASGALASRSRTALVGSLGQNRIPPHGFEPASSEAALAIAAAAGYSTTDLPFRGFSRPVFPASHYRQEASGGSVQVAGSFGIDVSPGRQNGRINNSPPSVEGRQLDGSESRITPEEVQVPNPMFVTYPQRPGLANSAYHHSHLSPRTSTQEEVQSPDDASRFGDTSSAFSGVSFPSSPSRQKRKTESPPLTFIHETAEQLIKKEEERRRKLENSTTYSKARQKKRLNKTSPVSSESPEAPRFSDAFIVHEHTQLQHSHPLSPPALYQLNQVLAETQQSDSDPSLWLYLSGTITSGPRGAALARLEDVLSEDVLIRALLHGWDAVGHLSPFWRIIRAIDETGLSRIGVVERFAVYRLMHLNLRYASEPTPERAATRPAYMNTRIEYQGDDYMNNFTPWPGLRDAWNSTFRSNSFVKSLAFSLRIQWPGDIHDCYTRDRSTGLYAISPDFDATIFDLRSWSFDSDFFERYPMLYGVATVANAIPRSVGGHELCALQRQLRAAKLWRPGMRSKERMRRAKMKFDVLKVD